MDKRQIQVYADPEVKRRIELAAARHEVSVTEYCLSAILQQLADEDLLEREQIEISTKQIPDEDLLAKIDALHEKVLERRGGNFIKVDIIKQIREERDYELTGLC
jgi:uncharacterized protein (DUF1778 family)